MYEVDGRVHGIMKGQFRMTISKLFVQKPFNWQHGWKWEYGSNSLKKYLINMTAKARHWNLFWASWVQFIP